MNSERAPAARKWRILHVFRAPLGGLFRHVLDLAGEQAARGHEVGLFFDSASRGPHVEAGLARLGGALRLGVGGCPIRRNPHPDDALALARFMQMVGAVKPDIVHGHGSKGGAYARLPWLLRPSQGPIRAYTPHGGSFNYIPDGMRRRAYLIAEKVLTAATDVLLFESAFIAGRFDALIGDKTRLRRIVANGLTAAEFAVVEPEPDAADFLYVGELRAAKGVDTFLEALAGAGRQLGEVPRAVLVGSGPDREALIALGQRLGLADRLSFPGPMPAREAFRLGRCLVVPSRVDSLPYIVLEAAAAQKPLIASDVGGIPEIFGPYRDRLGPSDDPQSLCARMLAMLGQTQGERARASAALAGYVAQHFSIETMVDSVLEGYAEAMQRRAQGRAPARLSKLASGA
jgi:glycosyltransferase involved in cell wall biosynthesis